MSTAREPSQATKNPPSATVYAKNLPYDVTEDEVRQFFQPAGNPTRIVLQNDRETGRFRGCAFVSFPSVDIAESAVRNLNKSLLKGREIHLDFSKERRPATHRRIDGAHPPNHPPPPDLVHVQVIPSTQNGTMQAPMAPASIYTAAGGITYQGVTSAPPSQPVPPGGQIVYQPGQPQIVGQPGQVVGGQATIIMTPDGQILSGAAPGSMVMQGPMHAPPPGNMSSGNVEVPAPGTQSQQMLIHTHGAAPPAALPVQENNIGVVVARPGQVGDAKMQNMSHRAPHELQHDLPVGIPTAQHVCPDSPLNDSPGLPELRRRRVNEHTVLY